MKNKGLLIGLGVLGVLAFYGSSKASAATTPLVPPTPPTPPPPEPNPLKAGPPPVAKPKPKPKVDVSIGPAVLDAPSVPTGWIAARPTPELDKVRSDVKTTLGDSPAGTKFPFQLNDKKYLAVVLPGGEVGILQPEFQI